MTNEMFRLLLDLWMVSYPWLLGDEQRNLFITMLDTKAKSLNYTDIVDAYHNFTVVG